MQYIKNVIAETCHLESFFPRPGTGKELSSPLPPLPLAVAKNVFNEGFKCVMDRVKDAQADNYILHKPINQKLEEGRRQRAAMAMSHDRWRERRQGIPSGICQNNPCDPVLWECAEFSTKNKASKSVLAALCAMGEDKEV